MSSSEPLDRVKVVKYNMSSKREVFTGGQISMSAAGRVIALFPADKLLGEILLEKFRGSA